MLDFQFCQFLCLCMRHEPFRRKSIVKVPLVLYVTNISNLMWSKSFTIVAKSNGKSTLLVSTWMLESYGLVIAVEVQERGRRWKEYTNSFELQNFYQRIGRRRQFRFWYQFSFMIGSFSLLFHGQIVRFPNVFPWFPIFLSFYTIIDHEKHKSNIAYGMLVRFRLFNFSFNFLSCMRVNELWLCCIKDVLFEGYVFITGEAKPVDSLSLRRRWSLSCVMW